MQAARQACHYSSKHLFLDFQRAADMHLSESYEFDIRRFPSDGQSAIIRKLVRCAVALLALSSFSAAQLQTQDSAMQQSLHVPMVVCLNGFPELSHIQ
jgi:hypothetical protein